MGNSHAGSAIGNWFKNDLRSIENFTAGAGAALGETFTGLTGGGWNYGGAGRDFTNYGHDVKNAFTNRSKGSDYKHSPQSAAQIQAQNINRAINPNNEWNKVNWQSVSSHINGAHYGAQAGLSSVTPPSYLMSISDPHTKMLIANSRGASKNSLAIQGAYFNAQAAPTLQSTIGTSGPSDVNNSGGAPGIATPALDGKKAM